jgi:hypothetical protein
MARRLGLYWCRFAVVCAGLNRLYRRSAASMQLLMHAANVGT